jgi:hypothetical protein
MKVMRMSLLNFGRVAEVLVGGRTFSMKDYNLEATIPFDSDTLPNEAEVKIWNLSHETLTLFQKKHDKDAPVRLQLNAGYTGDVGLLLSGTVSSVETVWDGVDKITTIHVLDGVEDSDKIDVTFAEGTYAKAIIEQLAKKVNLPVAVLNLVKNYQYEDGYSASDTVMEIISKVAQDCQTRAYIQKGKLYVRSLRDQPPAPLKLGAGVGLIGLPEFFADGGRQGFRLKQQLQYRLTTGSVVELSSSVFQGKLYVQSGTHHISRTGDFMTESEALI